MAIKGIVLVQDWARPSNVVPFGIRAEDLFIYNRRYNVNLFVLNFLLLQVLFCPNTIAKL